jgi:hypothetical protein
MNLGFGKVAGSTTSTLWNGRVDDVRMYQRVVTPGEIRALMGNYFTSPSTTAVHLPTATAEQAGALQGSQQGLTGTTAIAYNGTGTPYNSNNGGTFSGPSAYTIECWFKVSGSMGGTLAGFTTSSTSMATDALRALYVDSGGKLTFGVSNSGTETTIRSPNAYNDGLWHHVAATQGATGGLMLYVDGALVQSAANPGAPSTAGYWRWSAINLANGWPNRPTSDYLIGTIDELAVYHTELSANSVARHYAANH